MGALLLALGLLAIGALLLVLGADWFLDGAGNLARALGVSLLTRIATISYTRSKVKNLVLR